MKKLCAILGSLSVAVFSSVSVVACKGGLDLSLTYTDEEKIMSIYNLTTKDLVKNGVKINTLVSPEEIDAIIKALDLNELINKNPNGSFLKQSLGVFIMSNQLLNEISSKVPGYGWIANKLTWQSQWSIKDLLAKEDLSLFNNVSGWMNKRNEKEDESKWSLSVTFLNQDKTGWNGVERAKYARININRRVVANNYGKVQRELSNEKVIYGGDTANTQDSFLNPNNPDLGVIYQGYANSSELIELDKILNENVGSIPIGFFNYSPSATDFVNNKIIMLDFVNKVLQVSKQEIEDALNDYLLNNPFFIGEGLKPEHIANVIKNQIYVILMTNSIDRKNLKDKDGNPLLANEGEEEESLIIVKSMINKLRRLCEDISQLSSVNSNLKNVETLINMLDTIQNEDCVFKSISKNSFRETLKAVIEDSRDRNDPYSYHKAFYNGDLNATLFKTVSNNQKQIPLTLVNDYLDFGFDNQYKFEVQYWGNSTPIKGGEEQWYSPDNNRPNDNYIADKGFRNIFLHHRFFKHDDEKDYTSAELLKKYEKKISINYDIFDFDETIADPSEEIIENKMLKALEKAISLDPNGSTVGITDESWRIYHLLALINNKANEKLSDIFSFDSNNKIGIHNSDISLDYWKIGKGDFNKADDDIAFAKLLKEQEVAVVITDQNSNSNSTNREEIFQKGIETIWESEFKLNIYAGQTNIYGKRYDQDLSESSNWWQDENRLYGEFYSLVAIPNQYKDKVNTYWKKYVSSNPKNPDYNSSLK
ncbi:hypothetical protein [Spiroplasma cantharicola]|uniref:Lipoprotein n=1 Tax=Spiroplasma cantharicola TaxID=362837 RepID=A0A0M4JSP6_9MOLU|nr:hypothetical protein [Spiroplasma cantharicola]ALD66622.1 hypothetical protein SCANT_v1c07160 [Spiroplasma cantharicola]